MRAAWVGAWLLTAAAAAGLCQVGEANRESGQPKEVGGALFLLPGEKRDIRLRLDLTCAERSPAATWEAFLDHLFDHFDRDGDGSLSREEVARMMPLPLPGGKELTIDFAGLDRDRNGKGSRVELKEFCRCNGFTPVVAVVAPPSADDARLTGLFLLRLDADGDGKLTLQELRRTPQALRRYDLNEDETLELGELLAGVAETAQGPGTPQVKLDDKVQGDDVVLRLDLGAKPRARLIGKDTAAVQLTEDGEGPYRLQGPGGRWWLTIRAEPLQADIGAARAFLVAQLEEALGDRKMLSKADLEEDATLAGFRDLLPFADRDGDNRLSLAELQTYLDLVERGLRAQVWVTATDRHGNPFPFLDRDGDSKLSYRELSSATDLLGGRAERMGLPRQFELSCGGPPVRSWGGVAVPAARRPVVKESAAVRAPAWFRAMDRNGDGIVSRHEFLGPPEAFRQLDTDGNGMISAAEAARAEAAGNRRDPVEPHPK